MRALPPALQAHLSSGATTMCYCWRLTRRDAVVLGFTDHDEDLTFDGTTFSAQTGFTATQVQQSLGLAVDNLNVEGALSSATINEDDLASGRYDDAKVELFWVNWQDTSQRIVRMTGFTGEAKRTGTAFSAELRGLTSRLSQDLTQTFQRICRVKVGSPQCGVNLTDPAFHGAGTIVAILGPRTFTCSGITSFEDGWFSQGVLGFTSGPAAAVPIDVKEHLKDAVGVVTVDLWAPPPFPLTVGWTFGVTAGCKGTSEMCFAKFANIVNFRGYNKMPGNDFVMRGVDPSALNSGSSSTTTSGGKG